MSAYIYLDCYPEKSIEVELPLDVLENCFHQGDCEETVKHYIKKYNITLEKLGLTLEQATHYVKNYIDGFIGTTTDDVLVYVVWMCSGEYIDSKE